MGTSGENIDSYESCGICLKSGRYRFILEIGQIFEAKISSIQVEDYAFDICCAAQDVEFPK